MTIISVVVGQGGNQVAVTTGLVSSSQKYMADISKRYKISYAVDQKLIISHIYSKYIASS